MRSCRTTVSGLVLLASALTGPSAWAQGSAGATADAASDRVVTVRAYQLSGHALIDEASLQRLLAPYTGPRTLADMRQAAQAVQDHYAAQGYGAVVAYLGSQSIEDGLITITVVEGKVASVQVQGAQRKTAAQMRAALPTLAEGRTPEVRRIDAELQIANENPALQVGVLLAPGDRPGEVQATVKVTEQDPQRWSLGLDNTGNDRTGRYRASLGWQHADLSGRNDVLSLQLQTSPSATDAVAVLSGGYRLPLVRWLSALDLFAAYSDVDGGVSASAAGNISFSGQGRIFGARWTRYLPRLGEFDQRLILGLEQRAYLNQCAISGLPPGACGPAGESVAVQPLVVEYAAQRGGAWQGGINLALAHNLALGGSHGEAADFAAVRPGAPRRYAVLRGGGQLSLPVAEDWSLSARASAQYSADPLVPGEQFGIGGTATVRGFEEREVTGDSGAVASLEIAAPRIEWAMGSQPAGLRFVAFVDAGQVRNRDGAPCAGTATRCTLSGVGLGARLDAGAVMSRLFLAQALEDGSLTRRGDWRTHFSLSASF